MGRIEKTVFISYRRTNTAWALAIYQNLVANGYNVFFDYESINSGDFEQIILGNIRARAHFLVLLTPSALDRCDNPDDWLRREIETALCEKRNIVPLFLEGFNFGIPSIAAKLTGRMADLKCYNGLNIPSDYFQAAMSRLQERFLNIELDTVLHPIPTVAQQSVQQSQNTAVAVEDKELLSIEWFEKGFNYLLENKFEDAMFCFNEVIRITPNSPAGYIFRGLTTCRTKGDMDDAIKDFNKGLSFDTDLNWTGAALQGRGQALMEKGDLAGALQDFNESIRILPDVGPTYFLRGGIYVLQGDAEDAYRDFDKAIRLDPTKPEPYYIRGILNFRKQNLTAAIKDINEAIRLKPDYALAYDGRSQVLHAKGNISGAIRDLSEAIRLDPNNATYYMNRGNLQFESGEYYAALADLEKCLALGALGYPHELEKTIQMLKQKIR